MHIWLSKLARLYLFSTSSKFINSFDTIVQAAGGGVGIVQNVQRGGWRGPVPEGVHAAAIEIVAAIAFVIARVAADHRDRFPNALGLVRPHAWPANPTDQDAARRERIIADHLG